jgi:precorrin-6B methylase 1
MLTIRCKRCGVELVSHPSKTKCCGCSNMTTIKDETITAIDLSDVVIVSNTHVNTVKNRYLTDEDLQFQASRKNRKVKKLDFEVR